MELKEQQLLQIELDEIRYKRIESVKEDKNILAERRKQKLQLLTMAKEILAENRRDKPTGERDITAKEIVSFAKTLNSLLDE